MTGANPQLDSGNSPAIVVLGLFPPPVTGAAKNTLLFLEDLKACGLDVVGINTAAGGTALDRSARYHLRRLRQFLINRKRLRSASDGARSTRLYFVPDGGLGLWYSAGYAQIARSRFDHVTLHHRTFQYIDRPSKAMGRICAMLAGKITHVFLSEGMKQRFFAVYGEQPAIVCTNARYVEPRVPQKPDDRLVIGHLGNLCAAKGFFEVADCFEALRARGIPVELQLAGPVVEAPVQQRLNELQTIHGDAVHYHGPVHGDAKDRFYDRLHVFLFATHWPQEAQPNVVYEAYAGGAAVVANARGCIAEMIDEGAGHLVTAPDRFVAQGVDFCASYWDRRDLIPENTRSLAAKMEDLRELSVSQHSNKFRLVTGVEGADDT